MRFADGIAAGEVVNSGQCTAQAWKGGGRGGKKRDALIAAGVGNSSRSTAQPHGDHRVEKWGSLGEVGREEAHGATNACIPGTAQNRSTVQPGGTNGGEGRGKAR